MKKLYKSETEKKIFGVCAGFAEYFDIDVTLIRVIWIIAFFVGGSGFLIYIICAIIMPSEKSIKTKFGNGSTYDYADKC